MSDEHKLPSEVAKDQRRIIHYKPVTGEYAWQPVVDYDVPPGVLIGYDEGKPENTVIGYHDKAGTFIVKKITDAWEELGLDG